MSRRPGSGKSPSWTAQCSPLPPAQGLCLRSRVDAPQTSPRLGMHPKVTAEDGLYLFYCLYSTVFVVAGMYAQKTIQIKVQSEKKKIYPKELLIHTDFTAILYPRPHTPHTGCGFPPERPHEVHRGAVRARFPSRTQHTEAPAPGRQEASLGHDHAWGRAAALSQEPSSRLSRGGGEKAAECGTKQSAPCQERGLGGGGGHVCSHVPVPPAGPLWPRPTAGRRAGVNKALSVRGRGGAASS